jgi:hypothetical protein
MAPLGDESETSTPPALVRIEAVPAKSKTLDWARPRNTYFVRYVHASLEDRLT